MKIRGYLELNVKTKFVKAALLTLVKFWRRRGKETLKVGPLTFQLDCMEASLARTGPMTFGLDDAGLYLRSDAVESLYRNLLGFFGGGSMRPTAQAFRRLRDFVTLLERVVLLKEEGQLMRPYKDSLLRAHGMSAQEASMTSSEMRTSVREWSHGGHNRPWG